MVFLMAISCTSRKERKAGTVNERPDEQPHVVFLISKDPLNYQAHITIPAFAGRLRSQGFDVSVLLGEGEPEAFRFPGLKVLSRADLLVVFCRRVALSHSQLDLIRDYLEAGKPLVGIRTANHAFAVRDGVQEGHEAWWNFVPDVLGCKNRGYGPVEPGTDIAVAPSAADHMILEGLAPAQWHSTGNVYHVAPLLDREAIVLLTGTAAGKSEPVAWARTSAHGSRVFYTSLGHPADFELPQFHTLLVNGIRWALGAERINDTANQ